MSSENALGILWARTKQTAQSAGCLQGAGGVGGRVRRGTAAVDNKTNCAMVLPVKTANINPRRMSMGAILNSAG